jgi:hypothetical protein
LRSSSTPAQPSLPFSESWMSMERVASIANIGQPQSSQCWKKAKDVKKRQRWIHRLLRQPNETVEVDADGLLAAGRTSARRSAHCDLEAAFHGDVTSADSPLALCLASWSTVTRLPVPPPASLVFCVQQCCLQRSQCLNFEPVSSCVASKRCGGL